MTLLEKIYYHTPVALQNTLISLYGLKWYNRRFGGVFKDELQACLSRNNFTTEEWNNFQTMELRKLLLICLKHVPYYKAQFKKLQLTEEDILNFNLSDLKKLPVLSKQTYRELGKTELLSDIREKDGIFMASSGSTGTPTQTYFSKSNHQKYFAIFEARLNYWAGVNYKSPRGTFGPRRIVMDAEAPPPYYRYNSVEKQVYFSAFHLSRSTVDNYLEGLMKYNIEYMTGYCMSNYILARFIEEKGLKAPQLKGVLTSSEKLTTEMRDTFQRVYGCKTFDSYNGVECCNLISECEHGNLHIIPDAGIVELINEQGNDCKPGEIGEIISTGLINSNQPLVRYKMGDYVKLSLNQNCKCGRQMPVVEEIVGRVMDTIIGKDGREMVSFYRVFTGIPSIIESQVVQHNVNHIDVNLAVAKPLTKEEELLIINRVQSQLGDIVVQINILDAIPKGANGKFKSVISHVKRS
ncbi:MAG: hypothetical protein MUC81_03445 [Bacteroidia bacterium]|jgi:phenylacetate-CoA ligase|nr:hypothetical protein [Bacteroidia bacterium]